MLLDFWSAACNGVRLSSFPPFSMVPLGEAVPDTPDPDSSATRSLQYRELAEQFHKKLTLIHERTGDGTFPNHIVQFHLSEDAPFSVTANDGTWKARFKRNTTIVELAPGTLEQAAKQVSFESLAAIAKTSETAARVHRELFQSMGYGRILIEEAQKGILKMPTYEGGGGI